MRKSAQHRNDDDGDDDDDDAEAAQCLTCWRRSCVNQMEDWIDFRALHALENAFVTSRVAAVADEDSNGNDYDDHIHTTTHWIDRAISALRGTKSGIDVRFVGGDTPDSTGTTAGVFDASHGSTRVPVVECCSVACRDAHRDPEHPNKINIRLRFDIMLTERYRPTTYSRVPNRYALHWTSEFNDVWPGVDMSIDLVDALPPRLGGGGGGGSHRRTKLGKTSPLAMRQQLLWPRAPYKDVVSACTVNLAQTPTSTTTTTRVVRHELGAHHHCEDYYLVTGEHSDQTRCPSRSFSDSFYVDVWLVRETAPSSVSV